MSYECDFCTWNGLDNLTCIVYNVIDKIRSEVLKPDFEAAQLFLRRIVGICSSPIPRIIRNKVQISDSEPRQYF